MTVSEKLEDIDAELTYNKWVKFGKMHGFNLKR